MAAVADVLAAEYDLGIGEAQEAVLDAMTRAAEALGHPQALPHRPGVERHAAAIRLAAA